MSIANTIYDGGENYFKDNYSGADGGMIDPISGEVIGTTGNGMAWTVSDLVKNQFTDDDSRKEASFVDGLRYGENNEMSYKMVRGISGVISFYIAWQTCCL